jgi:excisionase family DNA binding protein
MTDLTTTEAAKVLQVSERTIRNFIKAGYLTAYKLDPYSKTASHYRITSASIKAYITKRQQKPQ